METFFHISEIYNRKSILKNGLIPSKVKLSHHLERFKEDNILLKNENKILYMFQDSDKNEKFLKDMVFCKVWIDPRNILSIIYEDDFNNYKLDYNKYVNKLLYKYDRMIFDIYKITNIKEINETYRPYHEQISDKNFYNTLYKMPTEFEHNDKVLVFSKHHEKSISIIGQLSFEFTKNKRYNIKILKGIK